MASPVVQQAIESSTNTAGTSHVVTLPTATSGHLLLIILDKGSTAATINAHASLTELLDENAGNGLYIAYRQMDGSEPSSYTLTSSASTRSASIAYRISGHITPTVQAPQIGTTGTGTSATPDPPASATPGSSKDYLFIAFAGMAGEEADDDTWGNTPPTNYTPSPPRQKSCGTAGVNLGGLILSAERALTTGSAENPGTFGVDVSAAWRSQTIMITPAEPREAVPTTAAITSTTYAPTVATTANVEVTPTTATATLTAYAPTVIATDPKEVTPTTTAMALALYAPTVTVSDHQAVTPTSASLTISLFAPSVAVTNHVEVTPPTASLTTALFAPSVAASAHQTAVPETASLTASMFAPTVTATDHQTATPTTAALTLTLFTPTIDVTTGGAIEAIPTTASLVATGFAPTISVSEHQVATPSPASLVVTAYSPIVEIAGGANVTPLTLELSITCYDPAVSVSTNQAPKVNYNTRGRLMRHQGLAAMGASGPFRAVRGRH